MRAFTATLVLLMAGCSSVLAPPPPTPTPAPPPLIKTLPGRGFTIEGHGSAETDEVTPGPGGMLAIGIAVVTLSHNGRSTFMVTALQDGTADLLTSDIGTYNGQRPLVVTGSVAFDVVADGDWMLKVQPMSSGGMPPFSGRGDQVSAYFTPPQSGDWFVAHDGGDFTAYVHCVGGSVLVAQHSEWFTEARRIDFPRGPCFWEVRADGSWSLNPAR